MNVRLIRFMPCVYIRDQDPTTAASERNYDLLLERSPVKLVKIAENFYGQRMDAGDQI